MASLLNRRLTALLLKEKLSQLYTAVFPYHFLADGWTVNGIDDDLPDEGEVKAVLDGWIAIEKPALNARAAIEDVNASTEEYTGIFAVPSTTFIIPFNFDGPVWAGQNQSQGFGTDLTIQAVTIFCGDSGAAGDNLTVDTRIDAVSIFSSLPEIPINSGEDVIVIVPSSQISITSIPAASVVSGHIVTAPGPAPDDAQDVKINIWVKPA